MNDISRQSPGWHPDELAFLGKHRVLQHTGEIPGLTCIKQRWVYNTLREVFLTENGYILKRYSHFPGRKDYRKVWKREHDALCRLGDLNTPDSMGYINVKHNRNLSGTLHLRTLLPGSTVNWATENRVESLAEFMADIHRRHVVTLDPQHENFIDTHNHHHPIGFIDFGRARVFSGMNLPMLLHIGKDLAKLRIDGGLNHRQFEAFSQHYQQCVQFNALQNAIVNLSVGHFLRRRIRTHGRPVR
ncbi:MAG: hypothetical protein COB25_005255 [Oceanospirillales bacterium]|jgi:hypothetical protein|nr:hypothetical protein [Oceanospirillales bacterium]